MFDVRTYVILRHFCELLLLTSKGYRQQILNGHEKKKKTKKKGRGKNWLVGSTLLSVVYLLSFFLALRQGRGKEG